ncbi:hypothetical protein BDR26DRAFT_915116 [Obelidium mucronatum]|nr:hypothetical protein BDR26DRAFT_915116 [Obelidium mucronatum]
MDGLLDDLSTFMIDTDRVHSLTEQVAQMTYGEMEERGVLRQGEVHMYTRTPATRWVRRLLVLFDAHLAAFKPGPGRDARPAAVLPLTAAAEAAIVETDAALSILHVAAFALPYDCRRLQSAEARLWALDTWRLRATADVLLDWLLAVEHVIHDSLAEDSAAAPAQAAQADIAEIASPPQPPAAPSVAAAPTAPVSTVTVSNETVAKKPASSSSVAKGKTPLKPTGNIPARRMSVQVPPQSSKAPVQSSASKSKGPSAPTRRGTTVGVQSDKGLLRATLLGQQKQLQQQEVRRKRSNSMIDLTAGSELSATTSAAATIRSPSRSSIAPSSRFRSASVLDK